MTPTAGQGSSANEGNSSERGVWVSPRVSTILDLLSLSNEQAWERLKTDLGFILLVLQTVNIKEGDDFLFQFQEKRKQFFQSLLAHLNNGHKFDLLISPTRSEDFNLPFAAELIAKKSGRVSPVIAWIGALFFGPRKLLLLGQTKCVSQWVRDWNLPVWFRLVSQMGVPAGHETAIEAGLNRDLTLALFLARDWQLTGFTSLSSAGKTIARDLGIDECFFANFKMQNVHCDESQNPATSKPTLEALLIELLRVQFGESALHSEAESTLDQEELERYRVALRNRITDESSRLQEMKLKAMAEFSAGAGHEINNPLAVIQGHAQFLLGRLEDLELADFRDKLAPSLESIVRQAKRIHGILRQLMGYARPALPEPTLFDPFETMKSLAFRLEDWALEKRVTLELRLDPLGTKANADPVQIKTALECIVNNAIEAAAPDGWVRLSLQTPNEREIHFVVEDSGPGPKAEDLPHLFDPFYSGRQAGRGKGLGLSIAWKLATLNKGKVVYSLPSPIQPTTFKLILLSIDQKEALPSESPASHQAA